MPGRRSRRWPVAGPWSRCRTSPVRSTGMKRPVRRSVPALTPQRDGRLQACPRGWTPYRRSGHSGQPPWHLARVVPSEASRQPSSRPVSPDLIPGRACPLLVHPLKSERRWRLWPVGLVLPYERCQAHPAHNRGRGLVPRCPIGPGPVARCWAATGSARSRPGRQVGHRRQSGCPEAIALAPQSSAVLVGA